MSASIKIALQQITQDSNLRVLNHVADLLINHWNSTSLIGQTEWETAKNAVTKEERAKALRLFISELEKQANEQSI